MTGRKGAISRFVTEKSSTNLSVPERKKKRRRTTSSSANLIKYHQNVKHDVFLVDFTRNETNPTKWFHQQARYNERKQAAAEPHRSGCSAAALT